MEDWKWRQHLDPDDMTPEERWRRVVELLARAVARIMAGKTVRRPASKPDGPTKPRRQQSLNIPPLRTEGRVEVSRLRPSWHSSGMLFDSFDRVQH